MEENEVNVNQESIKISPAREKLAVAQYSYMNNVTSSSPWSSSDIDKMDVPGFEDYKRLIKECRFFYRKDPIASTVVNKLVEIGITDIVFSRNKLSTNEMRIFYGMKRKLKEYAEECALEYLLTGLIVPEIKYVVVPQDLIKELGVKKISNLTLPISMSIRDSSTIKILSSITPEDPSYFVVVPDSLIYFIQSKGTYQDGNKDPAKYEKLLKFYPEFVKKVLEGEREILLENKDIIRRKPSTDSPYPSPYLQAALESLKHKRNLKRMDYSIAARAIAAIQQFKVGNDEYPVTEDESEVFENLKDQMSWRGSGGKDIERIFQLFTNHTVEIDWIYPPLEALLNESKYFPINDDIFFSLGFPRILTTGETQRSNSSDPEFATLSPLKTMIQMQEKILKILQSIVREVAVRNNLPDIPEIRFTPISLHSFDTFIAGLRNLYDTGNISRTTYANAFGYDFQEEAEQMKEDKIKIKSLGLDEFAPKPYSNQPGNNGQQNGKTGDNPEENKEKPTTKEEKVVKSEKKSDE